MLGAFKILCVFLISIVLATPLPLRGANDVVNVDSDALSRIEIDKIVSNTKIESKNVTSNHSIGEEKIVAEDYPSNDTEVTDGKDSSNIMNVNKGIQLRNENDVRKGMVAKNYQITLTPNINDGTFTGRALIEIEIQDASTIEDDLVFHFKDLRYVAGSAKVAQGAGNNFVDVDGVNVEEDDGLIEISTGLESFLYTLVFEYTGLLTQSGIGFYAGSYDDQQYLAMNLHPTNARRVFPCIDEPNIQTSITFQFEGMNDYSNVIMNSLEADTDSNSNIKEFMPLQGVPHLWGMVAHNLNALNIIASNVLLYARPGRVQQNDQANIAINHFITYLNYWTGRNQEEIIVNQEPRLHIMAVPDVDRDWYALSTVCIWEPYVLMESTAAVAQRSTGFVKIAEAIARQWFGFVIYPQNWRHQWVIQGLSGYAAHQVVKDFQTDPNGNNEPMLDMDAIFVSDIIQESLLNDGYENALPLLPSNDLFDEEEIRGYMNGLVKTKATAIMYMLGQTLNLDSSEDYVRNSAAALLRTRALDHINSNQFYDTVAGMWSGASPTVIDDIHDFLEPWVTQSNFPFITVNLQQGGVVVHQECFTYTSLPSKDFMIPITYTTSLNPNFENTNPVLVMEGTQRFDMVLDDEDWVLFNIQGRGYYRVNYDNDLWERITEALDDPERRKEIHPINRATLIDDALNLARAGKLLYEVALPVVLTMQHETEYVVWKAFIRSMEFLRVRLLAYVDDDEDLDPDIYLRMVRRTVWGLENEFSFTPDGTNEPAMTSLARGLVMQHACKVGYQPCIAAAIDWFRDPRDKNAINPDIPADIRPAVYCANAMTGGQEERDLLIEHLDNVPTSYDRVVILEGLACSTDGDFITSFLEQTTASNSPYTPAERGIIFKAVVSSNPQNAARGLNFLSRQTREIHDMYGGVEKLEEMINHMAKNLGDADMTSDFANWVNSIFNQLDVLGCQETATNARIRAERDLEWDNLYLNEAYEWIDENDARTIVVSSILLAISLFIAIFNQ